MDLQFLIFVFPAGVVLCFRELRDEHIFVIIYSVMASYFAGVMVRLILTLTPVVCVASAIAFSTLIDTYVDPFEPPTEDEQQMNTTAGAGSTNGPLAANTSKKMKKAAAAATAATPTSPALPGALGDLVSAATALSKRVSTRPKGIFGIDTRLTIILHTASLLIFFVLHCTWVTANAYSSPSVVLASSDGQGGQTIIDDFREAYYWLRQNTPTDAVVMSWWDYGYQIAGMADRPTLVDNNTWNNSLSFSVHEISFFAHSEIHSLTAHIATVGKAMSSSEEVAYPILRKHDVDYVLVIFGGVIGYSGDDINKFLWMVRIAQGVWPDEIQEPNYFTPQGEYRVDEKASQTMKNSLMYKMSYYRFVCFFACSCIIG